MTAAALTLAGDHLTITATGGPVCRRVSAAGEVDLCTAPQLATAIDAALAADTQTLLVDLTAVTFLGAAGVRAVAAAARRAEAAGVRLWVRVTSTAVRWPLLAGGLGSRVEVDGKPAGAAA